MKMYTTRQQEVITITAQHTCTEGSLAKNILKGSKMTKMA